MSAMVKASVAIRVAVVDHGLAFHHSTSVRRPPGNGREQRVPEDRGLPGRMGQRVSRHAGLRGAGDGAVGPGGGTSPF
jgi:hypothetical protein